MARGKFITIEGIEGTGKSTQMSRLVERLEADGIDVRTAREPGGTPTAEQIRDVVLSHGSEPMPGIAELLLMFAARAVLVENLVRPALAAGQWVVCDRFADASRAYQSGGRGLPMQTVDTLAEWVLGDLEPDLTILLDAPVGIGLERTSARGDPDRLDSERAEFYERVRATYLELAARRPERWIIVDASGDVASVGAEIDAIAGQLLGDK